MGKLFNLDSPVMRVLGKIADIMWLNFLTAICCIPIVTAGASFTALHYCCLRMVRDRDGYVTKDFFKSFKENIKQATLIWLIVLVVLLFLGLDYFYMFEMIEIGQMKGPMVIFVFAGICVVAIMAVITLMFLFPYLSHFQNTIKGTFYSAFMMGFGVLPKTILMAVIAVIPMVALFLASYVPSFSALIPVTILFWFSGPAYLRALLYNKTFKRIEPEEKEADDFAWTVSAEENVVNEETTAVSENAEENGDKE